MNCSSTIPRPEQYLTLFVIRLNPDRKTLEYVGAGHPPGYIMDAQGNVRRQLDSKGSPLGWFRDSEYQLSEPIPLITGDVVLLLTDGITEAMTPEKNFYGEERLLDCIRQNRHKSAKDILRGLLDSVREFVGKGKQRDDMTAVAVKVLPSD